jgi:inosine-uridine nucleoside N-ribohydrolase
MMGGLFTDAYPEKDNIEWNILGDPAAAEIVYRAPVQPYLDHFFSVFQTPE